MAERGAGDRLERVEFRCLEFRGENEMAKWMAATARHRRLGESLGPLARARPRGQVKVPPVRAGLRCSFVRETSLVLKGGLAA